MKKLKKLLTVEEYLELKKKLPFPSVAYVVENDTTYVKKNENYILVTYDIFCTEHVKPTSYSYVEQELYLNTRPYFVENEELYSVDFERHFVTYKLNLKPFVKTNPVIFSEIFGYHNGYGFTYVPLVSIDFSNANIKISSMDFYTPFLESITFGDKFDTSNVTDMYRMFYGCESLISLDLSSFNTSNVTNMTQMFNYCSGLTSLNVSSFNTSNVTNMHQMFSYCTGLTSLDVSSFDTSKVTDMSCMFEYCSSLTSLDVNHFNTSKVTNMGSMFEYCQSLTSLDLSNFDTINVINMNGMFRNCSNLTSLDISNFNTY